MVDGETMLVKVTGGACFKLRRNALHFILDSIRKDLISEGYGTETMVGGINCYKSEKLKDGKRKIIEMKVQAEKA